MATSIIIIIAINVFFFVCAQFMDSSTIIDVYDLTVSAFSFQRPWQFLTSMFLHTDFWHILFNMYTLYFFGNALIRILDEKKFIIIYLVGGIAGGVLFALLAPPYYVALGASGAIFAVGAALAVMQPKMKVMVFPIPVEMPLWVALLGGGILISFFVSNVAWEAHLGGAIVGVIFGFYYRKQFIKQHRWD